LVTMAPAKVSLPKGDEVTVVEQIPRRLKAPVRKKPVGYVYVIADDQQPIRIPVEPQQSVPLNRIPRFWRN